LLGLSPESGDEHISDLVARCRGLEAKGEGGWKTKRDGGEEGVDLHRVGSTEEQEEVEK